jgi:hypothetical protein
MQTFVLAGPQYLEESALASLQRDARGKAGEWLFLSV